MHHTVCRVGKKLAQYVYTLITSSDINRSSTFFYCQNQRSICSNTITKDPITSHICRYTTL